MADASLGTIGGHLTGDEVAGYLTTTSRCKARTRTRWVHQQDSKCWKPHYMALKLWWKYRKQHVVQDLEPRRKDMRSKGRTNSALKTGEVMLQNAGEIQTLSALSLTLTRLSRSWMCSDLVAAGAMGTTCGRPRSSCPPDLRLAARRITRSAVICTFTSSKPLLLMGGLGRA